MYDYLFYKSYLLAKKSGNFEDAPVLGGLWSIMLGILFNFFTIIFLLDSLFESSFLNNKLFTSGKYLFSLIFILVLILHYKYNDRWKKVVEKYEMKDKKKQGKPAHPIFPVLIFHLVSIVLLFLAAMYKNKYWIFG